MAVPPRIVGPSVIMVGLTLWTVSSQEPQVKHKLGNIKMRRGTTDGTLTPRPTIVGLKSEVRRWLPPWMRMAHNQKVHRACKNLTGNGWRKSSSYPGAFPKFPLPKQVSTYSWPRWIKGGFLGQACFPRFHLWETRMEDILHVVSEQLSIPCLGGKSPFATQHPRRCRQSIVRVIKPTWDLPWMETLERQNMHMASPEARNIRPQEQKCSKSLITNRGWTGQPQK